MVSKPMEYGPSSQLKTPDTGFHCQLFMIFVIFLNLT